jgi:hypothetical protein
MPQHENLDHNRKNGWILPIARQQVIFDQVPFGGLQEEASGVLESKFLDVRFWTGLNG